MTDFDDRFRAALDADDKAFLETLEQEPGIFAQWGNTFQGPMKYWTIVANIIVILVTLVGIYAVWQFVTADTTRQMLLWGGAAWAAWTAQVALKQWLHNRMMHVTVLRELKTLNLRIAHLER